MTLDQARRGNILHIISIPDQTVRAQALRFGIAEGEVVTCAEVIPSGPIVIRRNHQEIAVGRRMARGIAVDLKAWKGKVF